MSVFSELDAERRETAAGTSDEVNAFTLDAEDAESEDGFDDDEAQQAEADAAQAALTKLNDAEAKKAADDKKRREHEESEAKRKAEWDAKQAAKKAAYEKALAELASMNDDAVMGASVKRTGADLEKLTRRNMKMCVTEHIQTLCLDDPAFARLTMHPRKSMINCFKYINRKAREFMEQEMKDNDEKAVGDGFGGDVPDDLCYQWAEDYFRDPDAKEDTAEDEKFVPKTYYGGSSSTSKSRKKEPAKPKPEPKKAPEPPAQEQLSILDGGVTDGAA